MFAPWALLLVALGLAAATYLHYRRRDDGLSRARRATLTALRLASLALLVFALSGPVVSRTESQRRARPLAVALDASASMGIADSGSGGRQSRLDSARDALRAVLPRLASEYDVTTYSFAEGARLLGAGADPNLASLAPAGESTAIGDSLIEAAPREGPAAVLLLSDGASNAGRTPSAAAEILAARRVSIFPVMFGRAGRPNIAVRRILGPRVLLKDEPSAFFVEVAASGGVSGPVNLRLESEGKAVASATAPASALSLVRLDFKPDAEGDVTYTVVADAAPGEENLSDNRADRAVRVVKEKLKVLYVENEPRWEYRFIKNAMIRDARIAPSLLLIAADKELAAAPYNAESFPRDRAELFKFDCVVIGDVPPEFFAPSDVENLRAFVSEGGGGLLFIAGADFDPSRYAESAISQLLPADPAPAVPAGADGYAVALTAAGAANPALTLSPGDQKAFWPALPRILWVAGVRPRAAATVLAETQPLGAPVIIDEQFGRGHTALVATDELWRWRSRGGDKYLYRLWAQLVRFLGARRLSSGEAAGELALSADEYPKGAAVEATAYLENGLAMPLDEVSVQGVLEDDAGKRTPVTFSAQAGARGLYTADFPAAAPGRYNLSVRGASGPVSAAFTVSSRTPEDLSRDADPAALETLAAATGGKVLDPARILDLLKLFPPAAAVETRTIVTPLWASYWFLIAVAALLSAEWYLRKRWGLM
jgi:hypothetical protein